MAQVTNIVFLRPSALFNGSVNQQPMTAQQLKKYQIIGYEELPGIELTDMAPSLPSRQVRRRVLTMMSKREMRGYEGDIQLPLPIPNSLGYII